MTTFRSFARRVIANGLPAQDVQLLEEELRLAQRPVRKFPKLAVALETFPAEADTQFLIELGRLRARLAAFCELKRRSKRSSHAFMKTLVDDLIIRMAACAARQPPLVRTVGRPRTPWWKLRLPRRRGPRTRLTSQVERWFIREIDSWKQRFASYRTKCTDSDALRVSLAAYRLKGCRAHRRLQEEERRAEWVTGITQLRARSEAGNVTTVSISRALLAYTAKLFLNELVIADAALNVPAVATRKHAVLAERRQVAKAQALELQRSPVFARRREHLARLRSGARRSCP